VLDRRSIHSEKRAVHSHIWAAACNRSHVCAIAATPLTSPLPFSVPLQAFFLSATVVSVSAACSNAGSLDTSSSYFAAVNRIATDDSVSGASDVTVAGDFTVHYDTYFKVVQTHCGTHQPSGCVPQTYILRLCGGAEPTAYNNGTALPTDSKHFTIPVSGVALPGSTPVTFLEMLGLRDKIKLVNPTYVHSPCVQELEESEQIDTQGSTWGTTDWADRAGTHAEVEVVFTDSWSTGASGTDRDVVFDASSDPGVLARAEWIKFVSVFFNEEERANVYFGREQVAFNTIATSTAALADANTEKSCIWVSHYDGTYTLSFSTYKQELCVGAGLTPWTDATALAAGSYAKYLTSDSELHAILKTIDVVIDETYHFDVVNADKATVLAALSISDPADTSDSLKSGGVFLRTDGHVTDKVTNLTDASTNSLDWYESAIARPALVLADLAHKVWPSDISVPASGCSRYFRDVLAGDMPTVNGKDKCSTWSAAENEQTCLNNAVLASDVDFTNANITLVYESAGVSLAGAFAAFLVAAVALA
jgi:hypothetical protein